MKCRIFNNDCMVVMDKMVEYNQKVDIVLTSPPYNTGRPSTSERSRENMEGRYDVHFIHYLRMIIVNGLWIYLTKLILS